LRAKGTTLFIVLDRGVGVAEDGTVREWAGHAAWRRVSAEIHLEAARVVGLLHRRVIEIDDAVVAVARLELQRRHDTVAFCGAHVSADLDAIGRELAGRHARIVLARVHVAARAVEREVAAAGGVPRLVGAVTPRRQRRIQVRVAEGDADAPLHELVDEREARAVTLVVGVGAEIVIRVLLATQVERDRCLAVRKGPYRAHIDGAREPLGCELRVRRLVDDHRAQELGGVLVELDAAIVAGADLFAPVQQRGREPGVGPAQADGGCAAFGTLRGQPRQARDGLGDAGVGELADVLGGDRLDDAHRLALGFDCILDANPDAGDDDAFQLLLRRSRQRGGYQRRSDCHAQQVPWHSF
jgi:hypothetical protein